MDKPDPQPQSQANEPPTEAPAADTPRPTEAGINCVQCGYPLKGLPPDGACPECGLEIRITRDKLHGLSSRQFFTILLRLFAITVVITPIVSDFGLVYNLAYMLSNDDPYNTYWPLGASGWFEVLAPTGAALVVAGLLWYFAPILACLAVPVNAPLLANVGGAMTALMIGITLFAVWFVATSAQSLAVMTTQYATGAFDHEDNAIYLPAWIAGDLVRIILGVFILGWVIRRWDKHA